MKEPAEVVNCSLTSVYGHLVMKTATQDIK